MKIVPRNNISIRYINKSTPGRIYISVFAEGLDPNYKCYWISYDVDGRNGRYLNSYFYTDKERDILRKNIKMVWRMYEDYTK